MGTEKIADLQATAAYNFVPLGPKTVPAEFVHATEETDTPWPKMTKEQQQDAFAAHVRKQGGNSGWFDLDIRALTPLLIGGAGDNGRFFAPQDPAHPVLPGSSLRGMTRSLLKILACGAMRPDEDFENKKLYFRVVAAYGDDALKTHYDELTYAEADGSGGSSAGFLVRRQDDTFYISPCSSKRLDSRPANMKDQPSIDWQKDDSVIAMDGPMTSKNRRTQIKKTQQARYQLSHGNFAKQFKVPPELIYNYESDPQHALDGWTDRDRAIDLLDAKWSHPEPKKLTGDDKAISVIPCHFVLEPDGKTVRSFGHGPKYRIPYAKSIGEHVPPQLRKLPKEMADLADAIFGVSDLWSGRVSFEDAQLAGTAIYEAASLPRPQMVPKPTAYQMYLEQGKNSGAARKHWDSEDANLRGYKFYWHNSDASWRHQPKEDLVIKGSTEIQPLKKGAMFHARVHFQDLSDIELGALCAVFALGADEKAAYKLGRGKALGLGSVRIRAALHLQDEAAKYHSFFAGDGQLGHVPKEGKASTYLKAFEDYRTERLGSRAEDFQKTLLALQDILDFTLADSDEPMHDGWAQQIATMPVGNKDLEKRFARHVVLPDIRTVVAQAKARNGESS